MVTGIGGWFLLFVDIIGYNIIQPNGIPAGIMVALIGAPCFIYLSATHVASSANDV
ncbi:iron chelate uptake ABC transporter family permease subunit [Clostridium sp. BSD9I1]|uniref:iron chelate uptake ABC transporter family permease subunit n=1 Tax=Clostridium sp. BSD9I1 TaxID=2003589 RepID=UPI0035902A01